MAAWVPLLWKPSQEEAPCKVSRLGVNDQYGHSGPGAKLLEEYGFTAENIAARAKELLK